jgi:prepilin-type N-terminal cleavage/methylation domain-containing protein
MTPVRQVEKSETMRLKQNPVPREAFTLIELLTVIAIIAVLASLLMTSLVSANKKSRAAVCTFNLHQISLALNLYLDDEGKHPTVDILATSKYLPTRKSLLCPEDKTLNWGRLVDDTYPGLQFGTNAALTANTGTNVVNYSYLMQPFGWNEENWRRLMQFANAGVAACQLHGLGRQDTPNIQSYAGLLLRGQRDGSVVRRKVFWYDNSLNNYNSANLPNSPSGTGGSALTDLSSILSIYLDNPDAWLQTNP